MRPLTHNYSVLLVVATCCWLILSSSAPAGSGSTVSLPYPNTKVKTGLRLELKTEWIDGNGYRPVRVRVSTLNGAPTKADRNLRVVIQPSQWGWGGNSPRVSTWVELPEGKTFHEVSVPMPQFGQWGMLAVETFEDGVECDDLSHSGVNLNVRYYSEWSEAMPSVLVIDPDAASVPTGASYSVVTPLQAGEQPETMPDIRSLAAALPQNLNTGMTSIENFRTDLPTNDAGLLNLLGNLPRLDVVSSSALPQRWIELTSVDALVVPLAEIRKMEPMRWAAIRTWLSTGSTLIVHGVGDDFERLAELEQLLEAPEIDADKPYRGWDKPSPSDYSVNIVGLSNLNYANRWVPGAANPRRVKKGRNQAKPNQTTPFVYRGVDRGAVVAIAAEDPFPGTVEDWGWIFNSVHQHHWMWYQRHGMSMQRENRDAWNLLIPGIGDAPVGSFLILISMFVIVIGPVNYLALARWRRLYLLLVTVPIGAGVITIGLFGYAVVSDGLGLRLRARSLTTLDQASGRVVSWARQTYYAGLAPSEGLWFPPDSVVYPVEYRPEGPRGRTSRQRMEWGEGQGLERGYMRSRTSTNLLVVDARKTDIKLEITETPTALHVTNKLGVDVQDLLVCDSQGRVFHGIGVSPESTATLEQVELAEVARQWNDKFIDNRPGFPEGFDPRTMENAADIFPRAYYSRSNADHGSPDPTFSSSVLERGLRGIETAELRQMQPGTYLAITDKAPEMSIGHDSANEEASFHVLRGRW